MTELVDLPAWCLFLIFVGGTVTLAIVLEYAVFHWLSGHLRKKHDLISLFASSSGVLYSVLLAMIATNAWQDLSDVGDVVEIEAYTVASAYRNLVALPEPIQGAMRHELHQYVQAVVGREWPALRRGERTDDVRIVVDRLYQLLAHFKPADQAEAVFLRALLEDVDSIAFHHRQRVASSDNSVMPLLWLVVVLGGLLNIITTALAGSSSRPMDRLLLGIYAANIGLVIFFIYVLDNPYRGTDTVPITPFLEADRLMHHLDQHVVGDVNHDS
ncbi:MAG: hypothetical protein RIQ52_948 [Pseudomonadota bacterium]